MFRKAFLLVLIIVFAAFPCLAQQSKTVSTKLESRKLESKLMGRQLSYNVILPSGYDVDKTSRFPVLYLLHGLYGRFDDWAMKSNVRENASGFNFIIVMPEGENGWYVDSATDDKNKYESYLMQELIPTIDREYRTIDKVNARAIAGLSMGGYGSLKFGLKYPEKFGFAASMSGALNATSFSKDVLARLSFVKDSIDKAYGEGDTKTRLQNDIFKLVQNLNEGQIKSTPFIYLDCGTEDGLIDTNQNFAKLLREKKIKYEFRELPGGHDWKYWSKQILEVLQTAQDNLKTPTQTGSTSVMTTIPTRKINPSIIEAN
ncbi:MAG: esterase family protein [Pyrinomonadaceae bacterium]|nr:esterase family protein [Pyrinomonadaceae bacterium]